MGPAASPADPALQSIRQRAQWLVVAAIVPAWLLVTALTYLTYQHERDNRIAATVQLARTLAKQVDAQLDTGIAVLQTLAASNSIAQQDYKNFHAQVTQALAFGQASNIVLFDTELRGLASAVHPYGTPLPQAVKDRFPQMPVSGKPAVSEIFTGEVSKRTQVALAVPVLRDGLPVGRLEMLITPQRFASLIEQQAFPPTWTAAVLDASGNIVARNRDAERMVGKPATASLRQQLSLRDEGSSHGRTSDGVETIGCFHRSRAHGWAVAIGVPMAELRAELARSLGLVLAGGVGLLGVGLLLARRMGREIARPVQALVAPALALGRGEAVSLPPTRLKEAAEVGHALRQAHQVLQQRNAAREQAEAALRDSQSRLLMALELSQIGDWELDLATRELRRSARHDQVFGYAEPQPNWHVQDFVAALHPDDRERVQHLIQDVRIHGTPNWQYDCRIYWPDGSLHWIATRGTMVFEHGQPARMLGTVVDITERKQAEELRIQGVRLEAENRQMHEANRLKSEFLANMSHELRTPLNAVIGFADILRSPMLPPDSPKRHEYLGHIANGGRHLLQLINDVLDLAKVESGKFEFFPEPLELPKLAQEVLGVLQAEAARKQITLVCEHAPDLQPLVQDAARLKQVLYNFLSNAIKFTGQGGRVVLRTRMQGPERVRIEVEDTGIGISAADQLKLFVPFQQVNAGFTKQHAGTGLGLALTRRLVELQGGSVGLSSELGVGSVFHVVLPRTSGVGSAPADVLPPPAQPGALRVLVIEDDVGDQARLVQALSAAGYQVDVCSTAERALQLAASQHYDAVTLDLLLPDRSGLQVLAELRGGGTVDAGNGAGSGNVNSVERAGNRSVPVIVVTMVTETSVLAGFRISDVLHKPIRAHEVLAALRRAGLRGEGAAPRIMVVDDEPAARDLMAATLQANGMEALCFGDGHSALAALDELQPEAMILDLSMPGFNGFDVLQSLRERPGFAQLPVFVWTSMELSPAEWAELSRSAQAIAGKAPGGIDTLVAQIRQWHAQRDGSPLAEPGTA